MKARFKTIIFSALSTIAAFSAVTYNSCTPDKCKAIVCAYGGVCNNGACICQTGYEGTQCEVITRSKFTGVWQVVETGTITNIAHYSVAIQNDNSSAVSNVLISNFYNSFTTNVSAYVKGDSLYIPQQTINGKTVQGWGVLQNEGTTYDQHDQMQVYYKVTDTHTGTIDDFGIDNGTPSIWSK